MEKISLEIFLKDEYVTALERVTAALKEEGFGVLTEIDVRSTLKKKLDADFRPYTILGACNPSLAYKALQSEPIIGLMLPCNVTVQAVEGGSLVNLINPKTMMLSNPTLADNQTLKEVAQDAYDRMVRVAEALQAQ